MLDSDPLTVLDDKPALKFMLENTNWEGRPFGCDDCPFGKELGEADGVEPPNYSDPSEGYYNCSLTGLKKIWGEEPKCERAQWQQRAKEELLVTATPTEKKTKMARKGMRRVRSPKPTHGDLELAKEVLELCDRIQDEVDSDDGHDFAESVREKADSIRGFIESHGDATPAQRAALGNMRDGCSRWLHE